MKRLSGRYFLLLIIFIPVNLFAGLKLNVNTVYKHHIDKHLELISEVHFNEIIFEDKSVRTSLKNGLQLYLKINYYVDSATYGPSDIFEISGYVVSTRENVLMRFPEEKVLVQVGSSKKFVLKKDKREEIEITLSPELI